MSMMKVFLVILLYYIFEINCLTKDDIRSFHMWKKCHNKAYKDKAKEKIAFENFRQEKEYIEKHNRKYEKGEVTFKRGAWSRSDLTTQEKNKYLNGMKFPKNSASNFVLKSSQSIEYRPGPPSINWTSLGYVTEVQDQGTYCASCWSFAAVGALEAQFYNKTGVLKRLSEQNLIDCNKNLITGNWGCNGGLMGFAYNYMLSNKGIEIEKTYPYQGNDTLGCKYNASNSVGTPTNYIFVSSGNETLLQNVVAEIGPVAVGIDASHESFISYTTGVYYEPLCSSVFINHAVLVVGYGTDVIGGDYWLIKNSWGTDWGIQGYFKLARNKKNHCGITNYIVYPRV